MGGQLFSAPKMDNETYYRTCSHVCNTLAKKLNRYSIIPECFIKKTSHGDIDCLLDFPLLTDEELSSHFGVSDDQIHHNSSVISIFYQNSIQIDFCHFEPENLVSAYNYMSNSDCGNMVAKLLDEQVLFVGWDQNFLETITLYVNCSDVFAWGGADAEPVKSSELPELFEMHDDDPIYGSTKWVCKKRNMQPQFPLIEKMKEYDKWDAQMEALPKNRFNEKYKNT
jgi:hypothetical protein